jgi:hypothetical protein
MKLSTYCFSSANHKTIKKTNSSNLRMEGRWDLACVCLGDVLLLQRRAIQIRLDKKLTKKMGLDGLHHMDEYLVLDSVISRPSSHLF